MTLKRIVHEKQSQREIRLCGICRNEFQQEQAVLV